MNEFFTTCAESFIWVKIVLYYMLDKSRLIRELFGASRIRVSLAKYL